MSENGGRMYLLLNGSLSVGVYSIAVTKGFYFGIEGLGEIWRVFLVSTMAMILFRSAFKKAGENESARGPVSFLDFALDSAEMSLNHAVAKKRWEDLKPIIEGLTFSADKRNILAAVLGTKGFRSNTHRESLEREVDEYEKLAGVDEYMKMKLFAFRLTLEIPVELFNCFVKDVKDEALKRKEIVAKEEQEWLNSKMNFLDFYKKKTV